MLLVLTMPSTPTSSSTSTTASPAVRGSDALIYLGIGTFFGVLLVMSEVVSWFRIQEMFRFQAFHMYGIIGSAVIIGAASLQIIKRFDLRTIRGEPITIKDKPMNRGVNQFLGGSLFGLGWGLLGACPGPLYALIGAGITPLLVGLLGALLGAFTYGQLMPKLPH
jgi:uncharacterized protein